MSAQPASGQYLFAGDKQGNSPHTVPKGYPYLGVEIGGGMAAAYNHRTHMFPEDMPSMHTVDVADGFNGLGYVSLTAAAVYRALATPWLAAVILPLLRLRLLPLTPLVHNFSVHVPRRE